MYDETKFFANQKVNLIKAFSSNKMNISQNNNSKTLKGNFKQKLIKSSKIKFNSLVNNTHLNNNCLKLNLNENSNEENLNKVEKGILSSPKLNKTLKIKNENKIKNPKSENEIDLINKFIFYAKKGDKENFLIIIEKILNENLNLNYIDEKGFSALHYAVDEGNIKICEILIKTKKININIKNNFNNKTPLHISCKNGYFDITKLLIQNKANLNCFDNENNNPLIYCVKGNFYEVIKMILGFNNDYNLIFAQNIYGESPYSIAMKSNEKICNLFKEYENLFLSKKISNGNFQNKKFITTRNQKNLFNNKNEKIHSKGVLFNNIKNNNTNKSQNNSHKKLNSYISKNNFNNSNNCSKYSNQNTSTLCDSSNNSIKKTNHIYSISSFPKEINKKNDKQYIIINKGVKKDSKELINNNSFKAISNFKTSTTTNTITNNSVMKSSISSSNKDSIIFEDKINNKKKLYKKCLHHKINKSNILSKNNKMSNKIIKKHDTKKIIIELNDSDDKICKIKKIEIDLIDDSEIVKNVIKSRNSYTNKQS